LFAEATRVKNTLQDASMAREINRNEIIAEAKNRQNRYEETKNNFFNTITSTFQAYQGAGSYGSQPYPNQPPNPYGAPTRAPYGAPPTAGYGYPQPSNFGGYGGPAQSQYPQNPYGQAYPGVQTSHFGQPQAGYGYPQQPGMPGFPTFPGQNQPPNYPRGY
jgi:hypothetical protein